MGRFVDRLVGSERLYVFEELYIVPGRAPVDPDKVRLETRFSRSIRLGIPVASAPMDMVTGVEMAVALALRGGIGVLHRNCSREEQVEMARRVKEHPPVPLTGLRLSPVEPACRALGELRAAGVRDAPVVDSAGRVLGYVRLSSLRGCCREGRSVGECVEPGEVYLLGEAGEAMRVLERGGRDTAAVVSSTGYYLGTIVFDAVFEELSPVLDEDGRLRVAAAISPFDMERARMLDGVVDALVSDVAHFHNDNVLRAAARLAKEVSADFIAGNIGTAAAARDVASIIERVDGFRVGIGGGSICVTAQVAGAFAPTPWAVAQVRDALEELGMGDVPVIADGGIRTPADAVKSLALGASCVMLGYVLAGTDEASAPLIRIGGRAYKPYRGMASRGALEKRFAADRYSRIVKRMPEGIEGLVEYKGPVSRVLAEFVEGLKAGIGYAGASSIPELWEKAVLGRAPPRGERGLILSI